MHSPTHAARCKRPPPDQPEPMLTYQEAADALGVHYWQIQRAVKRGAIPSYAPFNSRRFVKLSEVMAFIDASRRGGVE